MTTTATYSFNVPTAGTEEDTWGALLNANWEKADDLLDGTDQVDCIRWNTVTLGSAALTPDGGNIVDYTMTANTTFTDSLADGDWLITHILGADTYTATLPTATWIGTSAPTLSAAQEVIQWWKKGSTLFAVYAGSA